MDKWKDTELEKMKVGGNRKAKDFFSQQEDWDDTLSIQQRYNTKAAALYRDKVLTYTLALTVKPVDYSDPSLKGHPLYML